VRPTSEATVNDGSDVAAENGALGIAQAAAARAGVDVVEVVDLPTLRQVSELLCAIWQRDPGSPQMTTDLLRALAMTGNYVAGAIREGELVGAAVGFYAEPTRATLHSHICGVSRARQASGIGYALKLHQRAWAIAREMSTITWTFDPLVRRNAYLNINKFRVRPREYLPNFYGEMSDSINHGDDSDRLLVEWDLRDTSVAHFLARGFESGDKDVEDAPLPRALFSDRSGRPIRSNCEDAQLLIGVPEDIEQLRLTDPALAREWRSALRAELGREMGAAAQVISFRKLDGYVVRRSAAAGEAEVWT
jgi:predicted GNAT superfamily acetyltransferase